MFKDLSLAADQEILPGCRLRQLLGRGSSGIVWEAIRENGEAVALKFLPSASGPASRQEIKAIQMIGKLVHPNLTPIYDLWSYKNYFVVAMELAEGSLQDLLDVYQAEYQTPIDAGHLCMLLGQAARAIDFLNARQHDIDGRTAAIQHCGIKPTNLLLFGETLKLADFGLASVTTVPVKFHRPVGTPAYMAPETSMGRLSDRTDQYALAVTYVHMRTGKLPWPPQQLTAEQASWPPPDLGDLLAPERAVIARALSPVPQERWNSCSEMVAQLTEAARQPKVVRPRATQQGVDRRFL